MKEWCPNCEDEVEAFVRRVEEYSEDGAKLYIITHCTCMSCREYFRKRDVYYIQYNYTDFLVGE